MRHSVGCRGICERFPVSHKIMTLYQGRKVPACLVCEVTFIRRTVKENARNECPCCNYLMRTRPHGNRHIKKRNIGVKRY